MLMILLVDGESDVPVVVRAKSSAHATSCAVVSMSSPTFGNNTSCFILEAFVEKMSDAIATVFGMAGVEDFELCTVPGELDTPTEAIDKVLDPDAGATTDAEIEVRRAGGVMGAVLELTLTACGTATKVDSLLMLKRAAARLFLGPDTLLSPARVFGVGVGFAISKSFDKD